jgi:hypothetical protein
MWPLSLNGLPRSGIVSPVPGCGWYQQKHRFTQIDEEAVYRPIVDQTARGEAIPAGVASRLKALSKSLVRDGQAVAHGDATVRGLETRLGVFVEKTLPMIRRLGGVE